MKNSFETPFQTVTRCIEQAAVIMSAGYFVRVDRQPAGNRALFSFDDTPHTRALIERFERRKPLDIPVKTILQNRVALKGEALRLRMEAV